MTSRAPSWRRSSIFSSGRDPGLGFLAALAEDFVGQGPQMPLDMVEIDALLGVLEAIFDQVPDPDRSVGHDQDLLGLQEAAAQGFGVELLSEGVQPQAGGDEAPFRDDRRPDCVVPRWSRRKIVAVYTQCQRLGS